LEDGDLLVKDVEVNGVDRGAILTAGRFQFGYGFLHELESLLAVMLLEAGRLTLDLNWKIIALQVRILF
jgi:hypothetical protein